MSLFEFISSMISVLIALAIAQLLISTGRLTQNRHRVTAFLPHSFWCVVIFLLAFLHWWSLWDFRDLEWNSAMFFYSLMGPLLMFFAVTLLSPDARPDDEAICLRTHYAEVRVPFLLVLLAALLFLTFDGPLFGTEDFFNVLRLAQLVMGLLILVAIVYARAGVQLVSSALIVLILLYATMVRFLPGDLGGGLPLAS